MWPMESEMHKVLVLQASLVSGNGSWPPDCKFLIPWRVLPPLVQEIEGRVYVFLNQWNIDQQSFTVIEVSCGRIIMCSHKRLESSAMVSCYLVFITCLPQSWLEARLRVKDRSTINENTYSFILFESSHWYKPQLKYLFMKLQFLKKSLPFNSTKSSFQ